jgi:hypothetical protein
MWNFFYIFFKARVVFYEYSPYLHHYHPVKLPGHISQPPGQALDILGPGLPSLMRRHLLEEVAHRIEACRHRRLAATAAVPKRVEIYIVVVGAVNVIVRGTTVLSLMSKSNDMHCLRHSCLRRLHEKPRAIFNPLQMCHGVLGHVGQPGQ